MIPLACPLFRVQTLVGDLGILPPETKVTVVNANKRRLRSVHFSDCTKETKFDSAESAFCRFYSVFFKLQR